MEGKLCQEIERRVTEGSAEVLDEAFLPYARDDYPFWRLSEVLPA